MTRVLLTGGTSFVGYHLAAGFHAAGHSVTATRGGSRLDTVGEERVRRLEGLGVPFVPLDLTDHDAVMRTAAEIEPEVWIQHAGYTKDYATDAYDISTGFALNVAPLRPIYAAMARLGGKVIVTGTVAEYPDSDQPHGEDEVGVPHTLYGFSKWTETLLAQHLARRHDVPSRVARLFLPFGPLDASGKVLPAALTALRNGEAIKLSPCQQRRDFVAVEDAVAMYLAFLDDFPRTRFDIFNCCSGTSPRLQDVILALAQDLGADPALCEFGAIPARPGEPEIVAGSNAKARELLSWTPLEWTEAVRHFARSADG